MIFFITHRLLSMSGGPHTMDRHLVRGAASRVLLNTVLLTVLEKSNLVVHIFHCYFLYIYFHCFFIYLLSLFFVFIILLFVSFFMLFAR